MWVKISIRKNLSPEARDLLNQWIIIYLNVFIFKIDNEEYGEALALAMAYNLDCDLVYQRQWHKSPVSVASINDYLVIINTIIYTCPNVYYLFCYLCFRYLENKIIIYH